MNPFDFLGEPGADVKPDLDKMYIVHYPDPHLRKVCKTVTRFDENLANLAQHMLKLMRAGNGVGLAGPQVGVLQRIFVMNITDEPDGNRVFVNPVIYDRAGSVESEEGCLSLPGIHVNVRRAKSCRIEAQDIHGEPLTVEGEDLLCRVWQHETDHLDGVLIIDRMGPSDRIATRSTLKGLEEGYAATTKKVATVK